MIDKERIKKEADSFFEWTTPDKSTVSTVSMIIFCNVIAEMARIEEREECAKVCDMNSADYTREGAEVCAIEIRARSNV